MSAELQLAEVNLLTRGHPRPLQSSSSASQQTTRKGSFRSGINFLLWRNEVGNEQDTHAPRLLSLMLQVYTIDHFLNLQTESVS